MPKKTLNDFINAHQTRYCLHFQFYDYHRIKSQMQKAQHPFRTTDGKKVPTPSQFLTKFVAETAKGDYAIEAVGESAQTGTVVRVMFSDAADALNMARRLHPATDQSQFQRGNNRPCSAAVSLPVDRNVQIAQCERLGLL